MINSKNTKQERNSTLKDIEEQIIEILLNHKEIKINFQ